MAILGVFLGCFCVFIFLKIAFFTINTYRLVFFGDFRKVQKVRKSAFLRPPKNRVKKTYIEIRDTAKKHVLVGFRAQKGPFLACFWPYFWPLIINAYRPPINPYRKSFFYDKPLPIEKSVGLYRDLFPDPKKCTNFTFFSIFRKFQKSVCIFLVFWPKKGSKSRS